MQPANLWYFKPIFNTIHSLKYQRSTTLDCNAIEIRKSEFVTKNQFLRFVCNTKDICDQLFVSCVNRSLINQSELLWNPRQRFFWDAIFYFHEFLILKDKTKTDTLFQHWYINNLHMITGYRVGLLGTVNITFSISFNLHTFYTFSCIFLHFHIVSYSFYLFIHFLSLSYIFLHFLHLYTFS